MRIRRVVFAFAPLFFLAAACQRSVTAAAPEPEPIVRAAPLLHRPIDESIRTVLEGNTRAEAVPGNVEGPVDDDLLLEHVLLQLKRPAEREQALQRFMEEQHQVGSPSYHRWPAAGELADRFGLAVEDLATVSAWLRSHGLAVNQTYPGSLVVDFTGTSAQIRDAFRTQLDYIIVNHGRHIANMSDPSVPTALAAVVAGIVSLNDFAPHRMFKYATEPALHGAAQPIVPADLATIYNLKPLFDAGIVGRGQTIAVIEDTNLYNVADWTAFRSTFGLSAWGGSLVTVHPSPLSGDNNCRDPRTNRDDVEATLDAEWASAAAPGATIEVASCGDSPTTFGGLIALENLLHAKGTPPAVISLAYGECEARNGTAANAAYRNAFQLAAAEGISVFVAAGDEGAAACDADQGSATHGLGVNAFASTPYDVAVGGTDFSDAYAGTSNYYWQRNGATPTGSAFSYVPEIPWNDSCAGGLVASAFGFNAKTSPAGVCGSKERNEALLTTAASGGGASGCATGVPHDPGVIGGSCAGYPKPSWQSVPGNPGDGVRDVPDVSLVAANGLWGHAFALCFSDPGNQGGSCAGAPGTWPTAGGTSFSTAIMAGIQALVAQRADRQGNPNYVYYAIASAEYGPQGSAACNASAGSRMSPACTFHDVTDGDTAVDCASSLNCHGPFSRYGIVSTNDTSHVRAFGAGAGWDFATGIGTINAANLVTNPAW